MVFVKQLESWIVTGYLCNLELIFKSDSFGTDFFFFKERPYLLEIHADTFTNKIIQHLRYVSTSTACGGWGAGRDET